MNSPREGVARAQEALSAEATVDIRSRWIELDNGTRVHAQEAGEGEPLILLHGTASNSAEWAPLMEHQIGRRLIAIDRPGFGLSHPTEFTRSTYRQYAVDVIVKLVDAFGLEKADLLGTDVGSIWALWTALDRPKRVRRLALLGATPLFPGVSCPIHFRLITTPGVGGLLGKLMPELSPELVVKMIGRGMGESDTIVQYPRLIDVFVAHGSDSTAKEATRKELKAMLRGLAGWRPEQRFTTQELGGLKQPVLLVWGERDPTGDPDVAHRARKAIPGARLQVLSTGNAPWWGEPHKTAGLISEFLKD